MDAHFSVFMNISSCVLYQTTIIEIWINQQKMPQMQEVDDVTDCIVNENFGSAREWLLYEAMAYYV